MAGDSEDGVATATFLERVFCLAAPSAALGHHAITEIRRLLACAQSALQRRWDFLLATACREKQPVLCVYGSDGWGTNLHEGHAYEVGGCIVRRAGKVRAEFLLERGILKTIDVDLHIEMAMRISVPRSLTLGKLGWHMFGAAVDYEDFLRVRVPSGICMSWVLQDGLHFGNVSRRLQARHELFYDLAEVEGEELDDANSRDMDWMFAWLCSSHVASNAVKWGMRDHSSEQVHDDIHIGIASLRNSSEELLRVVNRFVATRVVYEEEDNTMDQGRREFWEWLGVEARLMPEVLMVNPRWLPDRQYLSVSVELEKDPRRHDAIASVIVCMLRWRSFSETRWAGVVPSARMVIASWMVGVPFLVELVYADETLSTYKLGGWKRLHGPGLLYLAVAAIAMRPVHQFSLAMLGDDRFLKFGSQHWVGLQDDVGKVMGISMAVWDQLVVIISSSLDGVGLRDLAVRAMYTSIGYLHKFAFVYLFKDPFQLTQGSIADRVQELKRRPLHEVHDPIARKIHLCLSVGVSQSLVVRALHLLRDAPCSTGLVEKGHAAGALLRRQHVQYGSDLILTQSTLMQTAPLFRKPKVVDRIAERLRIAIHKAEARSVKYTAQNYFCSKLIEQVIVGGPFDAQESMHLRQQCIARHNALFAGLSAHEQHEYRQQATLESRRRQSQRLADIKALRNQLGEHLDALAAAADDPCAGVPNEVNSVRFPDDEIERIKNEFYVVEPTQEQQQAIVKVHGVPGPPSMPDVEIRAAIEEKAKHLSQNPCDACPWWLQMAVQYRSHMLWCGLAAQSDDVSAVPDVIYIMVLALQSPARATFLQCHRRHVFYPAPPDRVQGQEPWRADEYEHRWQFVDGHAVPFDEDQELVVLPHLVWRGNLLRLPSRPMALEVFLAGLPPPVRGPEATGKRARTQHRDPVTEEVKRKILEQWPWLRPEEVDRALGAMGMEVDIGGGAGPLDMPAHVVEGLVDEAMDKLADLRAHYNEEVDDGALELAHFYHRIQGGKWTAAHKGDFRDGVACYARAHARAFCETFSWAKQKGFATHKYGERACVELAREWARRGNYYCQLWWEADCDPEFIFPEVSLYEETEAWVDYALSVDIHGSVFLKIMECREARPIRVP